MRMKTIVALSTPFGTGGIAIVRMSGDDSFLIASKLVGKSKGLELKDFEPRKLYLAEVKTENFSDRALVVKFVGPDSFTGENMVEFQLHGGVILADGVIKECIKQGATMAEPGEFSKRAFLNGKMSLEEAEGLMDMIHAQSEAEINVAFKHVMGEFKKLINNQQEALTDVMAEINVALDYPGEDIEYETIDSVKVKLEKIKQEVEKIVKTYSEGKIIKHGIDCALIGLPNAGKSSLMNALLNEDRAIVSAIAGTTRDTITESFLYNGLKINLVDTAGLNDNPDEIEAIGVERAKKVAEEADVILYVVDASIPISSRDEEILKGLKKSKIILVKNKADLTDKLNSDFINSFDCIQTSVKNKLNIEQLKQKIYEKSGKVQTKNSSLIITNTRHYEALMKVQSAISEAIEICDHVSLDILTQVLQGAFNAFGEITGEYGSEKIIDTIFSKFCLGK